MWFRVISCIAGAIKVFIEYKNGPIAVAQDNNVLPIKYFGFSSYHNTSAEFFYDCDGENIYEDNDIKNRCRYADALQNEYKKFFKISDIAGARPEGYIVNFLVYIQAERDAHVLFTRGPKADRNDDEYEIGNIVIIAK